MGEESARFDRLVRELHALVDDLVAQGAEKLPPERELALRLGVSRSVLRRALELLEKQNRIFRILGRAGGAFISQTAESAPIPSVLFDVKSRKVERDLNHVKGVPQMLAEQGFVATTAVISESIETAPPWIAGLLGLSVGADVVSLLRLRFADDVPLSLERMYLNPMRFPDLLSHSPIESLYHLLKEQYGVTIHASDETIEHISAERQVAGFLSVKQGSPLLALRRVSYDVNNVPVEASVDLFRPDRTRLTVRAVYTDS